MPIRNVKVVLDYCGDRARGGLARGLLIPRKQGTVMLKARSSLLSDVVDLRSLAYTYEMTSEKSIKMLVKHLCSLFHLHNVFVTLMSFNFMF